MIIGDETRLLDSDSVDQSGDCDAFPCSNRLHRMKWVSWLNGTGLQDVEAARAHRQPYSPAFAVFVTSTLELSL
jgi:hypothetical protein